jgi:CheY-like chemotaxis protein
MDKKRILIVEDEAISAIFLKNILQNEHLILGICSSGRDAIDMIADKAPDLLIMDICLEDELSGIDVMNEVLKTAKIDHIYCTAYSDKNILIKAEGTSPIGIIIKPVNIAELKAMLKLSS